MKTLIAALAAAFAVVLPARAAEEALTPNVGVTASSTTATVQSPILRPEVKVGETWVYNHYDEWTKSLKSILVFEVTGAERGFDVQVSDKKSGRSFQKTYTEDWNEVRDGPAQYSPFFPKFFFPIEVGKSVKRDSVMENKAAGSRYTFSTTSTWTGAEQITVPAGTFDTYKIEILTKYHATTKDGSGSGTMKQVIWYSPKVKQGVKSEYETTSWAGKLHDRNRTELVEFKSR